MFVIRLGRKTISCVLDFLGRGWTIIVQGPISRRALISQRLFYLVTCPLAKVIFSGDSELEKVLGINYINWPQEMSCRDIVLEVDRINSERKGTIPNNVAKQIFSTRAGLLAAETDNTVKVRSDCVLCFALALTVFKCVASNGRVLTINFSIPPIAVFQRSPAISDWFFMGGRIQLLSVFSTDYPINWYCSGRTRTGWVSDYYEMAGYNDRLQAEEFLTGCLLGEPYEEIPSNMVVERLKELISIGFGPAVGLIHFGSKTNYWIGSTERATLEELEERGLVVVGSWLEVLSSRFWKLLKSFR